MGPTVTLISLTLTWSITSKILLKICLQFGENLTYLAYVETCSVSYDLIIELYWWQVKCAWCSLSLKVEMQGTFRIIREFPMSFHANLKSNGATTELIISNLIGQSDYRQHRWCSDSFSWPAFLRHDTASSVNNDLGEQLNSAIKWLTNYIVQIPVYCQTYDSLDVLELSGAIIVSA